MLSLGRLPWQTQVNVLRQLKEPTSPYLQFTSKPSFPVYLDFFEKSRTGLRCKATKTKEMGIFDEVDEEDPDANFEDSENEEDDDEGFIPLENMKKWEANKPRGFGEGMVYDTSIEDELMIEIEQSRKAQALNLNNLKNKAIKPAASINQVKGATNMEEGYKVRLVDLPKKKNIHRDLSLAFNGVAGLLNIAPVVSGNKKTRDPVCKGLAFINFKYQDQAHRFVQDFSGKTIVFGKIEKQIKCDVVIPTSPKDQPLLNEGSLSTAEDIKVSVEEDSIHSSSYDSSTVTEQEANRQTEKKATSKRRKVKITRTKNILGAANRLKTREKAMLTGVLSKYGGNSTATTRIPES